jgi:hypothetical protein
LCFCGRVIKVAETVRISFGASCARARSLFQWRAWEYAAATIRRGTSSWSAQSAIEARCIPRSTNAERASGSSAGMMSRGSTCSNDPIGRAEFDLILGKYVILEVFGGPIRIVARRRGNEIADFSDRRPHRRAFCPAEEPVTKGQLLSPSHPLHYCIVSNTLWIGNRFVFAMAFFEMERRRDGFPTHRPYVDD